MRTLLAILAGALAGVTDQLDKLIPLQDRLARFTRVVTYNRAGYGRSEPGPLPRDSGREADELKTLLERASVKGPYVLVGHSLGALNVQVFAARYPDLVAGLVLLDPPPLSFILGQEYGKLGAMAEKMTAEWQGIADAAAKSADPREVRSGESERELPAGARTTQRNLATVLDVRKRSTPHSPGGLVCDTGK
jgi:pimeloyl-ACP methyl ester carboxylesterase